MASYDFAFKLNPGLKPLLNSWEIAFLWADKADDKTKQELRICIDKWITSGELKSIKTVYRPTFWPKHAPNRFRIEVHRDDFREWLIKVGKWPVDPDCELAKWWPDDQLKPIKRTSPIVNLKYDKAKEYCIAEAEKMWEEGSEEPPGAIAKLLRDMTRMKMDKLSIDELPALNTIKNWIRQYAPDGIASKRGRPKKD